MKKPILYFVLLLSANFLLAQGSLTFDPLVPNVTNGMVDFTFDLDGGGAEYDLSVEVSFDNGVSWADIPAAAITGDLNNVEPATGIALQWDAMASFPGQVTDDARLRVTARHVCGTDFTFTYPAGGTVTVTYGTIERNGLCWMDRNLGATRVPTSSTDNQGYGDLFQWGRLDDGHQDRTSSNVAGPINQDIPGHNDFITVGSSPLDWRAGQNDDLWKEDGTGINNPCPSGWRVPTEGELDAERQSWGSNNLAGAYASTLKWSVGGLRNNHGTLINVGDGGYVRSSSVGGTNARTLFFGTFHAAMSSHFRAYGMSVRCVREP